MSDKQVIADLQADVSRLRFEMDALIQTMAPMVEADCNLVADALIDFMPHMVEDPVLAAAALIITTPYREDFVPALRMRARIGIALNRELTVEQKRDLRLALRDDEWMEKVRHEIAVRAAAEGWKDFRSLIDWFKEHWMQVLQILLALLPLFLATHGNG